MNYDIYSKLLITIVDSYNPLERRESCKGGKEASKKSASSQSTNKGVTAAPKAQSSHNARRHDVTSVNPTTQAIKTSKPSAVVPAYDEQVDTSYEI